MSPLRALVGVLFFSGGWFALQQYYYLLAWFGSYLTLALLVALVLPLFWLGGWLKNHRSARVRAFGEVYLALYEHTALLQATVLTALVLSCLYYAFGDLELPASRQAFLVDFFPALGLLSVMIYGASAGMEGAFNDQRSRRVLAWALCLVTCFVPILAFFWVDGALDALAARAPGLYVFAWLAYLTLGSWGVMRLGR